MIRGLQGVLLFALLTALGGCYTLDPERESSPWYREGRYHNLTDDRELAGKGFGAVMRWKLFGEVDPPSVDGDIAVAPETIPRLPEELLAPPGKVRVVWIGHATVWIASNQNGRRFHVLTDPIFGAPVFGMSRYSLLPMRPEDLPEIHAVVVSHAHRDHLNFDDLRLIQRQSPNVKIYLPSGLGRLAKEEGLSNVIIQEWWQKSEQNGGTIDFLPAYHWSRMGLNDLMQYHWGSYALRIGGKNFYFGGDTGFSEHFARISDRYPGGFDLTLMPIGAYKPRWFMRAAHVDPPEALQANRILGGRYTVPVHWGAFPLGDDLPGEAGLYMAELLRREAVAGHVWRPGEIIDL